LRSTPMLLAVTPLPRPLTTPPVTSTYFIFPLRSLHTALASWLARVRLLLWEVEVGRRGGRS
jgi:hypothetical protein